MSVCSKTAESPETLDRDPNALNVVNGRVPSLATADGHCLALARVRRLVFSKNEDLDLVMTGR